MKQKLSKLVTCYSLLITTLLAALLLVTCVCGTAAWPHESYRFQRPRVIYWRTLVLQETTPIPEVPVATTQPATSTLRAGAPDDEWYIPPLPERWWQSSPGPARDVPPLASLVLYFDQPMDRPAVERAFRVDPPAAGTFHWRSDSQALAWTPESLLSGRLYHASLDWTAFSAHFMPLAEGFAAGWGTEGAVHARLRSPQSSITPDDDVLVVIQFDHPMVSGTITLTPTLTVTPALAGDGYWSTSDRYVFRPRDLAWATAYTATLRAGLHALDGAGLLDDVELYFFTEGPRVVDTDPPHRERFISTETGVRLVFNQPMNRYSVENRFSLQHQEREVNGTFTWPDARTMIFTPTHPLEPGVAYDVILADGAQGQEGHLTASAGKWGFATRDAPHLLTSDPAHGNLSADVQGRLILSFSVPMNQASVTKTLSITPEAQIRRLAWSTDNTQLTIHADFDLTTICTVTLGAQTTDLWDRPLQDRRQVVFRSAPLPSRLSLYKAESTYQNTSVYNAYDPVRQYARVVNEPAITYTFSSLTLADYAWSSNQRTRYGDWQTPITRTLIATWSDPTGCTLNAGQLVSTTLAGPDDTPLPPGIYLIQAQAGTKRDEHALVVATVNLALKYTRRQALVWATDLRSGRPVPDLPLRIVNVQGTTVVSGTTNADGVWQTDLPEKLDDVKREYWESVGFYVVADSTTSAASSGRRESPPHFGLCHNWWGDGISTWDMGLYSSSEYYYYRDDEDDGVQIYAYTDRPIYRPGQTVYFKGLVREDHDGDYTIPTAYTTTVRVEDAKNREIYRQDHALNEFGTFHGELHLDEESSLGAYDILVGPPDERYPYRASFDVAEYRKPAFNVSVQTDRTTAVHGDVVSITIQAQYYHGAPVPDAQVTWEIRGYEYTYRGPTGDYHFSHSQYRWWNESDSSRGRFYGSGKQRLNPDGTLTLKLPIDLSDDAYSRTFVVEATVRDATNQYVSNSTAFVAHKSDLYVGVRVQGYVKSMSQPVRVEAVALDFRGEPRANQTLKVELVHRDWHSVRERDSYGRYRWRSTYEDTTVLTRTVTTDGTGQVRFDIRPQTGGQHFLRVRGLDRQGQTVQAELNLWVYGDGYVSWGQQDDNLVNLYADKREYEPGDTARILVTVPFSNSLALLTTERGNVLSYEVIRIAGTTALLEVPITGRRAPNTFVSVSLIKGQTEDHPFPAFRLGYVELKITKTERELNVTLTPDQARYQPGETAVFDVRTTDYTGQPVSAELSLSLVDAAVLALLGDNAPPILDAFYYRRPLLVDNAQSLVLSIAEVNERLRLEGKGGGGGDEETARRLFRDTAYWNATVVTGEDGRAQVRIPLPDNLTTWRLRAKGITADTRVGDVSVDIVCQKDIMVEPALPRFLSIDDQVDLGALVHNRTAVTQTLAVTLQARGVELSDPETQTVALPPGGQVHVTWKATAPRAGRSATLRWQADPASDGVAGDAVEWTLPILAFHGPDTRLAGDAVAAHDTQTFTLPDSDDLDELILLVNPSLAASVRDGLETLTGYPYGCVEQTMSRMLPDAVVARIGRDLDIVDRQHLDTELPQMVQAGLTRLYDFQHVDGGFGWWKDDQSNPVMTAYVLFGLRQVQQAGFPVDEESIHRVTNYLHRWLVETPADGRLNHGYRASTPAANVRAYALYALAEVGAGDRGLSTALYERRDDLKLPHYARAYLALSLYRLNDDQADSTVHTLLDELEKAAVVQGDLAYWNETVPDRYAMNTNVQATAVVLDALVRIRPQSPLIPKVVRWLMTQRRGPGWGTTQETSTALIALLDYLVTSGELEADYTYRVAIDGREVVSGTVSQSNLAQPVRVVVPVSQLPRADRHADEHQVTVTRWADQGQTGQGVLHYTLLWRRYQPGQRVCAVSQGITVSQDIRPALGMSPITTTVPAGSLVRVRVQVTVEEGAHYVVVESPLPAGLEAVDPNLRTTGEYANVPLTRTGRWDHVELRDEKVALFASYLGPGTHVYEYLARATVMGRFQAAPPIAYPMYDPSVYGCGAGGVFTVR